MKRKTAIFLSFLLLFVSATACSQGNQNNSQNSELENGGLENGIMYLHIGSASEGMRRTLTATLVDNSSTRALKQRLAENPITINMNDYGGFEKVGGLGMSLPTNNVSITASPGDIILYQGNQLVIFYGSNSWSYTRLGRINNITQQELRTVLGTGNVTVTLSLTQ